MRDIVVGIFFKLFDSVFKKRRSTVIRFQLSFRYFHSKFDTVLKLKDVLPNNV